MTTIEDLKKEVNLKYKRVKVLMPVCPLCEKPLSGNNSILMPYECYECKIQVIHEFRNGNLVYILKNKDELTDRKEN